MPIADYDLVEVIGRGGFGDVYLGTRVADGIRVAVKLLKLPDEANLRRFAREARLLRSLTSNRHVVALLDWSLEGDQPFIAMEFCGGGSLRAWVSQPRTWQRICAAMTHAASGLAEIHAVGGFHRDIKPDNLLVTRDSTGDLLVKVGDFGLARWPGESSGPLTRSPGGTVGYMAPEVRHGADFDSRCDVYSLGVTAIELLTGSRDPASLRARPDIPDHLRTLLEAMSSQDPSRRPHIMHCHQAFHRATHPPRARQPVAARATPDEGQTGMLLGGLALVVGGVALATMNKRDANGRFHGSDGRFRSGRWG